MLLLTEIENVLLHVHVFHLNLEHLFSNKWLWFCNFLSSIFITSFREAKLGCMIICVKKTNFKSKYRFQFIVIFLFS